MLRKLSYAQETHGRELTLLRHEGAVICFDQRCSHMGGPLGELGEIENIAGLTCIRCPWHNYRVLICTSLLHAFTHMGCHMPAVHLVIS